MHNFKIPKVVFRHNLVDRLNFSLVNIPRKELKIFALESGSHEKQSRAIPMPI